MRRIVPMILPVIDCTLQHKYIPIVRTMGNYFHNTLTDLKLI